MSDKTFGMTQSEEDDGYKRFENSVLERFREHKGPLFTTNAAGLFDLYYQNLPKNNQHYNCRCCKNLIERVFGVVRLTQQGYPECAAIPHDVPGFFEKSVRLIRDRVLSAQVTGVFLTSEAQIGTPISPKGWTHLWVETPEQYKNKLLTADQRAAELAQEWTLMRRTILEYTTLQVEQALNILKAEKFVGYEKGLGVMDWFYTLKRNYDAAPHRWKDNLLWWHVATAPAGFTHLRTGMSGTLLDDIKAGKTYAQCEQAWRKKMNPSVYRRPTAAISEGQVKAAERTVELLGIERSLERRFANPEDMPHVFWNKQPTKSAEPHGLFRHLLQKPLTPTMQQPATLMTWHKFQRDVLPTVRTLEIQVDTRPAFMQMVTATHDDAPPVLIWDLPEARNPVSYYVYRVAKMASHWNVNPGWNAVDFMSFAPFHGMKIGDRDFVFFCVRGARDTAGGSGIALFPETLKAELKPIEKVIEKFSNDATLTGKHERNVAGLAFSGQGNPAVLRVNGSTLITLDRWE